MLIHCYLKGPDGEVISFHPVNRDEWRLLSQLESRKHRLGVEKLYEKSETDSTHTTTGGLADDSLFRSTDDGDTRQCPLKEQLAGRDWSRRLTAIAITPLLEGERINAIEIAPDGAVWISVRGNGLARYAGGAIQAHYTVTAAPDGTVRVGALDGASRFDGSTWTTFTTADGGPSKSNGLADNIAQAIVVASDGSLWFGTYSGVSRYGSPW
jgi:sugar lactone lactonase YvrE